MKLKRVYKKHGSYYFVDVTHKWHRLCHVSEGEAVMAKKYSELCDEDLPTMPRLITDWKARRLNRFSWETQKEYGRMADNVAKCFEGFRVSEVRPTNIMNFLDQNFADHANTAKKHHVILGKLFKYAMMRGWRDDNPCEGLDLSDFATHRRSVLITHEAIEKIRNAALTGKDGEPFDWGHSFVALIDLSYLLWQRQKDIRELTDFQFQGDKLVMTPSKTLKYGSQVEIVITTDIRQVVVRAQDARRNRGIKQCAHLFPNLQGKPYTKSGINDFWTTCRRIAGVDTRFMFKDIRALAATDAKRAGATDLELQNRLVHTSAKTSEIYVKERLPKESALHTTLPWESSKN